MNRFTGSLILLLLLPALAAAQHPQTREGFGISVGLGAGSAGFCDEEFCDDFSSTELSGYLRLGGYLSPSVFLAGETNGWVSGGNTYNDAPTLGAIMAVVQWYPMVERGLYLKGGLGYSYASLDSDLTTGGFAGSVGAGYDIRLARNFALTPYINYLHQFGGSYSYLGTEYGLDAKVHLFQFGLGFTWF